MKKVLVPNGNYTDIRLIKAFKNMDMYVVTSGNAPDLEGHKYADEYIPHDYSDKEGMLDIAKRIGIDYISACSNDFGVTTAAYIAEKMNLPGHDTYQNARIIAEKDLFKEFAQNNGINVIPSKPFSDEKEAKKYVLDADFPLIVKPTDLGGGKGVTRVDNVDEALKAIEYAFEKSKAKHIVIEPFITGLQGSICTFLQGEKVKFYSTFTEYDSYYNPFLVGYTTTPFPNTEVVSKALISEIEKMASILHLVDGIFHVQFKMHHDKPLIMECMRRCLGNYALKSSADAYNFPWETMIAKAYCGLPLGEIDERSATDDQLCAHFYIQAPHNGCVESVQINERLEPYIYDRIMQWTPGMQIEKYETELLGFLFMRFPNEEIQFEVASQFRELIHVNMQKN